jgi:hypothetical protein
VLLEDTIREKSPGLVILDPLQSHCGAPAASGKAGRSRTLRLLDHLSRLAEKYDCGMLLVRGLSRSRPDRAAELSPVRSELLAGSDPDDSNQRALVHVRSGCGLPGPTLAYIIDADGAFRWNGDSVLTPGAILMPEPGPAEGSALATAMEFLRVELARFPIEGRFVCKEAKRVGISASTLKRARARLRVLSRKRGGDWYWSLPDPPATEK